MPTFIRQAGVADASDIGLLTALPSIAAVVGMLALGASSDRFRERRWHIILPFWIGAAAMAASTAFTDNVVATVLLFSIAQAAIIGAVPVFFSLPATFLTGTAAEVTPVGSIDEHTFTVGDISRWMMDDYDKTVGKQQAAESAAE